MMKRFCAMVVVSLVFGLVLAGVAAAQQYPMVDMIANNVIEKYQMMNCEQIWEQKGKPKTPEQQQAIQMLRSDPMIRQYFINKVAGPIMNKMFECGMVP
jgi:Spy/CpxP family protein refolding chaperone